ncbi:MAG TPA: alkaline phosphatase family protein [Verrucomicrobiae bacterium]|jgi:hypothetical protein|nr:alkaline phosphatase family protein [Verrucomicrobiae bacterium]
MKSSLVRILSMWAAAFVLNGMGQAGTLPPIRTVFLIVMENLDWAEVQGNASAPYLNGTLLPQAAFCTNYFNPLGLHPSEPNYIWLEAGTNFGIRDDNDPVFNHLNVTNHLVSLLQRAGISWTAYLEDIDGATVPLTATNGYVPRHNPFVFFDDVTGGNDALDPYGIAHNRPYPELARNLDAGAVARYNFIGPNLCDDMHSPCPPDNDVLRQGDEWLQANIPRIMAAKAFQDGGAIFITWDESDTGDEAIGMVVLSNFAKRGYSSGHLYSHSSTLRTLQEIFGVTPWLNDAANAEDLSDLFLQPDDPPSMWISAPILEGNGFRFGVYGVAAGRTNWVEQSTNLNAWSAVATNVSAAGWFAFTNTAGAGAAPSFYRVRQAP